MNRQLSIPKLGEGQLNFRISLVKKRLSSFPLDNMDFIMADLEHPEINYRMADICTGDWTGRILEFLSCAEGIDSESAGPRLKELFERILQTARPSGLFGKDSTRIPSQEENICGIHSCVGTSATSKLFPGFLRYYELTGDHRALDTARRMGDYILAHENHLTEKKNTTALWVIEPFALLYKITGQKKYQKIIDRMQLGPIDRAHSHGYLGSVRGLQTMALCTDDLKYNEIPELRRKEIRDRCQLPDGCISEHFPHSYRNEGCSIADWIMVNLNSALLTGEEDGYNIAENTLWNALFFNQFVSGAFGHRSLAPNGYANREFQEAWWCCTENCGRSMIEYAKHSVTLTDSTLRINFLTSGDFTVPWEGGEIKIRISTRWPTSPESIVTIRGLPKEFNIHVRQPNDVKNFHTEQIWENGTLTLRLTGKVGHHLQAVGDRYLLKYGTLILAPSAYYWQPESTGCADEGLLGYIPHQLPGKDADILTGEENADGFLSFSHLPLPTWLFYEEGSHGRLTAGEASVNVPLRFRADGSTKMLYFWPMCYNTGGNNFYETPILFGAAKE